MCVQALAVLDGLVLQGTNTLDVKDKAAVRLLAILLAYLWQERLGPFSVAIRIN